MGGVVVQDEVDLKLRRDLGVDLDEELLELRRPVVLAERADHLARRNVERGEQARGAATHVVVGASFGGGGHHGEDRLQAVERLDPGLLVNEEHDGALGRVQGEANHVADLRAGRLTT